MNFSRNFYPLIIIRYLPRTSYLTPFTDTATDTLASPDRFAARGTSDTPCTICLQLVCVRAGALESTRYGRPIMKRSFVPIITVKAARAWGHSSIKFEFFAAVACSSVHFVWYNQVARPCITVISLISSYINVKSITPMLLP